MLEQPNTRLIDNTTFKEVYGEDIGVIYDLSVSPTRHTKKKLVSDDKGRYRIYRGHTYLIIASERIYKVDFDLKFIDGADIWLHPETAEDYKKTPITEHCAKTIQNLRTRIAYLETTDNQPKKEKKIPTEEEILERKKKKTEYMREWRKRQQQEYYQKNKKRILQKVKEYQKNNPQQKDYHKEYYRKNKERWQLNYNLK